MENIRDPSSLERITRRRGQREGVPKRTVGGGDVLIALTLYSDIPGDILAVFMEACPLVFSRFSSKPGGNNHSWSARSSS